MPEFEITTDDLGDDVTMISVVGFLDANTFELMENTINDLFEDRKFKLLINLSKVDYISSAGAGGFIGAIGESQKADGDIILDSPTENVKEVYDLLGLTEIFRFANSNEEGLKMFKEARAKT
jgi:anti-sigma B factor antagonist